MAIDEEVLSETEEAPDSGPFIICDNLVKIYKVAGLEVFALQGLDLVIEEGELLGVVGASGSGKSTLMNILGGLDRPSAGRVWVGGNDLLKMSDAALNRYRRSEVGFVWQQSARNLIPYLNATENVELPLTLVGQTGRRKKRRAEELLEAVGLAERRTHHLGQLSGGEQQRVAIAVALANSPKLLLADEPTGEVDSATAQVIYEAFRTLNREFNLTTLIVSHDPAIARQVERVVAIRDGKLASETVRQAPRENTGNGTGEGEEVEAEELFEELLVLDSAGRLQIPKEFLEAFQIRGRVRLEAVEGGILIKPVAQSEQRKVSETQAAELIPKAKAGRIGSLFGRFRGNKEGAEE
jgi:ABC-type lipoprotein export system ATPase subunit/bifunctional DNA-binding transcriptional regulator/antitoxin component of YhaV-PrlF toxin-antitoxin module